MINSTDIALLKRYILGIYKPSSEEEEKRFEEAADLIRDGVINSTDLVMLKRYLLGIITTL